MSASKRDDNDTFTRRDALSALVSVGTVLAFGCSHTKDDDAADAGFDGACAVSPEGEIGPYFADDSATGFNRSNILSNLDGSSTQPGVPLTLTVTVRDAQKSCAPYVGAQIDIWHCNASGVYSDIAAEGTSAEQWLRGYQLTDTSGQVTFTTLIPGWYSGRTTHIHLRVRSSYSEASSTSDGTNTTQCFFEQTFIDTLYTTVSPYSANGKNPTTNASDRVYSEQEDGANLLALTGNNTSGYTASVTIFLPITATYDAATPAGGATEDGGMPGGGTLPGDGGMFGPPDDGGMFGGPPDDAGPMDAGQPG